MSSKVVEANAGIHSLAMAVAVCSSLPGLSRSLPNARASLSLSRVGDCTVSVLPRHVVVPEAKSDTPFLWCLGVQTLSTLNAI